MHIQYIKGDATAPAVDRNKIIVHVCNDVGGWGKGFVIDLSKRWEEPEKQFRAWYKNKEGFALGEVQFVPVEETLWVANLIGQRNIYKDENGNSPIRYEAILAGLEKVAQFAIASTASVHMPRIGCGLAGGTWDKMEPLIIRTLSDKDIPVTVYDL